MALIQFSFLKSFPLAERKRLKAFLEKIFAREGKTLGSLSYIFCDDEEILNINRQFLQHYYYTDIITFDLGNPGDSSITAEIYISVDTVRSNALLFQTSFKEEMHRVIFHGILHLCGYGDKSPREKAAMRLKEDKYLELYFG